MDKETLERLVKEVLEELGLNYHVLTVFQEQLSPVWCVKFSESVDDVCLTREPGENEEAIKSKIRHQFTRSSE